MVLDLAILQISYVLVYYLRFHDFVYFSQKYRNLGILLFLTDLLIIVLNNSLHDVIKRSYIKELIEFGKHCLYVFAVVLLSLRCTAGCLLFETRSWRLGSFILHSGLWFQMPLEGFLAAQQV